MILELEIWMNPCDFRSDDICKSLSLFLPAGFADLSFAKFLSPFSFGTLSILHICVLALVLVDVLICFARPPLLAQRTLRFCRHLRGVEGMDHIVPPLSFSFTFEIVGRGVPKRPPQPRFRSAQYWNG